MERLIVGCGYLGRRAAALWQQQPGKVYATTRSPDRAAEFRAAGLLPVLCDVTDPASLSALPRVDTVLYCVGLDRAAGLSMSDVYIHGLRNVLERLPRPHQFLYVSSSSVYGQNQGELVDETSATEPEGESGPIVLAAERVLHELLPPAVILRFAGIYGPGRLMLKKQIESGLPLTGYPDRWLNLIHVDDGARVVLAAEQHARPGEVYNVCDDVPVLRGDFYRRMAQLMGAPEPQFAPPGPDTPPPRHGGHRRISNGKMHAELQVKLQYPGHEQGLLTCV